jgi:hypothetical protein
MNTYGPFYSNLHSEGNHVSSFMETSYENAKNIIRNH